MSEASGEAPKARVWTGRLEGLSPAELLGRISRERLTGLLRIVRHPVQRELHIQDGQVVFAASSDPNDRLGERLLRQRKIRLSQLEVALGQRRGGKRLGKLLVDAGALTEEELVTAVVCQLKAIVLGVLEWERGDYAFVDEPLATPEEITLHTQTSGLLLHGLRNMRSVGRIERRIGPPRTAYRLRENPSTALPGLVLTAGERQLAERLEAGSATIETLCRELVVGNWEILQALHALTVLGVAEQADTLVAAEESSDREGRLSHRSLPELLVALLATGETGVLQLHRDGVERRLHIDRGRCVFAACNNPDDGLLHRLFREGMITLADKEEAARRLLSNRRAGQILCDLGVLDQHDLQRAVHRQVSEIVLDSFDWTDGEYAFVPGPLPTEEEIQVDLSPAEIMTEGVRRIGSWTRLVQGCGGIDNPQRLRADHADRLGALAAGPEERQVLQALESARTLRRICRVCEVDDIRVCQIVWTLRLLGAVETVPPDEEECVLDDEVALGVSRDPVLAATPAGVAEVRAALRALPEEAATAASADADSPLDEVIRRFNAMHRVIFRAVRAEIGAGAVNFVRACCGQVGPRCAIVLGGVELQADGSWDAEALKRAAQASRIEDPWPVYQEVLDRLYLELTPHLGATRAAALKERILGLQSPAADDGVGQSSL